MALDLAVAAKGIESLIKGLWSTTKGPVSESFKRWKATTKIPTLFRKISQVRKVKTIWQIDKEIDLMDFYHPSKVMFDQHSKQINSLKDFEYNGNLIIEGTVGQGKSIFLRYLCAQHLIAGDAIPIFLELRHFEKETSFLEQIYACFDTLGIPCDAALFEYLANEGKVVLMLDGFDEVDEDLRVSLIKQVERISRKYESLRIVITSRPDSDIDRSSFFRVFKLSPISSSDRPKVIAKLTSDPKMTEDLVKSIKESRSNISQLLNTPLMITLLVITYKAEKTIPEQMSEFYDGLFSTLLSRHDKSKPGFSRKRKCRLNDRGIRDVFDALCFLARKSKLLIIPQDKLAALCDKAISVAQQDCDADSYISDIKKITCLLLEEGGKFHFVHKSISEYHCACFIRKMPTEAGVGFYEYALKGHWDYWRQDLLFLKEIDRYRYLKFFFLKEIDMILEVDRFYLIPNWKTLLENAFFNAAKRCHLEVYFDDKHNSQGFSFGFNTGAGISRMILSNFISALFTDAIRIEWTPAVEAIRASPNSFEKLGEKEGEKVFLLSFQKMLESLEIRRVAETLDHVIREVIQAKMSIILDGVEFVRSTEASLEVFADLDRDLSEKIKNYVSPD